MSDTEKSLSLHANSFSYLGYPLTRDTDTADAVVAGIPYDLGTTGRAGARGGPGAIRRASSNLRWEGKRWPWRFDLNERLRVVDIGDLEFENGNSADMMSRVRATARHILEGPKFLLSLGGDHFVSLPLLQAVADVHGAVALLHFDAHTDTASYGGEFDHGTMFYRANKEGLLLSGNCIQLGIRTRYEYDSHPFTVLDADWIAGHSATDAVVRIEEITAGKPVYLTIDIDCLDPAFAPGTGTPVAGGVDSNQLLQIVRGLSNLNLVAADIVEVAPAYDSAEITALAAATLGLEILHVYAAGNADRSDRRGR